MQTRLIGARKFFNLTQEEAAKMIRVSQRTYSQKENGHEQFKMNEMFTLARHFNMTVDDLFFATNFTPREDEK